VTGCGPPTDYLISESTGREDNNRTWKLIVGVRVATGDCDVKGGPGEVACAELGMLNGHILGTYGLRINAVKERDRASSENAGGDIARFSSLFRGFGNDRHRCRIERGPDATRQPIGIISSRKRGLCNI